MAKYLVLLDWFVAFIQALMIPAFLGGELPFQEPSSPLGRYTWQVMLWSVLSKVDDLGTRLEKFGGKKS